ncbi:MAG TPA: hypothetical protein PKD96_02910 [Candidatus Absconditabacterales bacterium]|nr:hypothetical protein [Candidatus Absconditabacterales bacterium]HMT27227.1 hypothetical protein [Candidatus Absconditabacterales bacterium]
MVSLINIFSQTGTQELSGEATLSGNELSSDETMSGSAVSSGILISHNDLPENCKERKTYQIKEAGFQFEYPTCWGIVNEQAISEKDMCMNDTDMGEERNCEIYSKMKKNFTISFGKSNLEVQTHNKLIKYEQYRAGDIGAMSAGCKKNCIKFYNSCPNGSCGDMAFSVHLDMTKFITNNSQIIAGLAFNEQKHCIIGVKSGTQEEDQTIKFCNYKPFIYYNDRVLQNPGKEEQRSKMAEEKINDVNAKRENNDFGPEGKQSIAMLKKFYDSIQEIK